DADGQAACQRQREGLKKIAAERIWKELKRTLAAPDPSSALAAMEEAGVLEVLLPGAEAGTLPGLVAVEAAHTLAPDPMRRLMALLPRRQRDTSAAAHMLRLSNDEASRLNAWADPALGHVLGLDEAARAELFYRFTPEAALDRALLEAAAGGTGAEAVLAEASAWQRPNFPIGGDDALAAGLKGPAIGECLRALEEDWIRSGFRLTRQELLAAL
ncbi:MAG: CCA tRNA nucleotidyltransferase, partial [Hyphomonas sp.]